MGDELFGTVIPGFDAARRDVEAFGDIESVAAVQHLGELIFREVVVWRQLDGEGIGLGAGCVEHWLEGIGLLRVVG